MQIRRAGARFALTSSSPGIPYDERVLRSWLEARVHAVGAATPGWHCRPAPLPKQMGIRDLPSLIAACADIARVGFERIFIQVSTGAR